MTGSRIEQFDVFFDGSFVLSIRSRASLSDSLDWVSDRYGMKRSRLLGTGSDKPPETAVNVPFREAKECAASRASERNPDDQYGRIHKVAMHGRGVRNG